MLPIRALMASGFRRRDHRSTLLRAWSACPRVEETARAKWVCPGCPGDVHCAARQAATLNRGIELKAGKLTGPAPRSILQRSAQRTLPIHHPTVPRAEGGRCLFVACHRGQGAVGRCRRGKEMSRAVAPRKAHQSGCAAQSTKVGGLMDQELLLAIDQGTTGTTSLVMDIAGKTVGRFTKEFRQHFPEPGLVEHEPEEIWDSVCVSVEGALAAAGISGKTIQAIGITNQRETTVVWDRKNQQPVHRAIVWQDRRTSAICAKLRDDGHQTRVRETTGLVLDPYFSGTKVAWILDNVPGARARAEAGELAFGTIDSYLVSRLSGSAAVHVTDVTNASRTLLMSLATLEWDEGMLSLFRVPAKVLPKIVGSAEVVARTQGFGPLPDGIPIAGIAGDQQAALFGQACFLVGDAKCTYGTGAFVLTNIGERPITSRFGLLTTVAWKIGNNVTFALEGSAFIAGAAVQWLRDGLGIIKSSSEIEALARTVSSSDGVTFVPALSGLGAPYWDPASRGLISGITRGTTAAHIARATLEGIALEVEDLLAAMSDDLNQPIGKMRVDGGAAANDLLMQTQADVAAITIERPAELESTARGAAMLAGVGVGLFSSEHAAAGMSPAARIFRPQISEEERHAHLARWADAVRRARSS